jgi:hypothetical protein
MDFSQSAVQASSNETALLRIWYLPALANVCSKYGCGISTSVCLSRILIAPMVLPGKFVQIFIFERGDGASPVSTNDNK